MKKPDIIEFWVGMFVAFVVLVMSNAIFWGSIYWLVTKFL